MPDSATRESTIQKLANKVPEITIFFWIIKILCTTVGETFADYINPFSLPLRQAIEAGAYSLSSPQGLAAINAEVTRQAAMLAYLQDFRLMMWVTLAAVPLVFLLRPPTGRPGANEVLTVVD